MNARVLLLTAFAASIASAGDALDGVTFIPGGLDGTTSLLGPDDAVVHTWKAVGGPYSAFLTPTGSVIFGSGRGTGPGAPYQSLDEVSWDNNTINTWTWTSPTSGTLHHGVALMPNGHWLALGYELLTNAQVKEAIGVSSLTYSSTVYNEHVIEYDPVAKKVVWEWDAKKHFSDKDDRFRINVNRFSSGFGGPMGGGGDVLHFNSVAYDASRDLVLFSAHAMNEILVVDHSTTTAEAATDKGGKYGKGGSILFRWGAAQNYGGKSGTVCNVVHGGNVVPPDMPGEGNFQFFCNSSNGTLDASAKGRSVAYEIKPVLADTGFVMTGDEYASSVDWNWYRTGSDYANYASSGNFGFVQALPNGNRFVSFSKSKRLVEISEGQIVKEISGCNSMTVRATRYPRSYPGISRLTSLYQPPVGGARAEQVRKGWSTRAEYASRSLLVEGLQPGDVVRVLDARGAVRATAVATDHSHAISLAGWANGAYRVAVQHAGTVDSRGLGLFWNP
ncbi:MAG: aryl-sulfate sulfotransferase [Fibrobacteria bacterium]|nr:aryl-sulfate sulfotransferase [Fibrobacteria bacterium]